MIDIKLKPCPFCGGDAKIQKDMRFPKNRDFGVWAYEAVCTNADCIIYNADNQYFLSEIEAIAAWNRRAPDSDSVGGHSGDKRERLTQAGKEFLSALTDYLTDEFRPIAEAIKTAHELYKKYFVSADLSQSGDNTTIQHIKFRDDSRLDKWQLAKLKYPNNKRRMNHASMIRRRAYIQIEKNEARRRREREREREKEGEENAAEREGKTVDGRRHKRHRNRRKKRIVGNAEKSTGDETAGNII